MEKSFPVSYESRNNTGGVRDPRLADRLAPDSTPDTGNLQRPITILSFPQEIFSDPVSLPQEVGNPPGKA